MLIQNAAAGRRIERPQNSHEQQNLAKLARDIKAQKVEDNSHGRKRKTEKSAEIRGTENGCV